MAELDINNMQLSEEQLKSCNDMAEKIETEINKLLDEFKNLDVSASYQTVEQTDDNVVLNHNVKPMMHKEYDFINAIDQIIEKKIKPQNNINGVTLNANLTVKKKMDEKEKKKPTTTETPTFNLTEPLYSFEQMVLDDNVKKDIDEALTAIECSKLIYETWGFGNVEPSPKSILNFYGAPGTGKTMAAHAVAKQLGKKLMALKYSEIESKYLGEATKNLKNAFDMAKQNEAVLFFDEADSFLGKRIEDVKQGSEQAINSLRSQMLIQLEEFNGVVIFATNLASNFDKAFESRILKHIKFNLPNKEARVCIIRKMTPEELPLEHTPTDDELNEVSDIAEGFAGREIKNAMLGMLLEKAKLVQNGAEAKFTIDDFKAAFERRKKQLEELHKEDKKTKIMDAARKKIFEMDEEKRKHTKKIKPCKKKH